MSTFATSVLACLALTAGLSAQTPLTTVRLASGLDRPLWAGTPPGGNRLYTIAQGQARIVLIVQGVPLDPPVLDLSAKVYTDIDESGLLGLAFHPDFTNNKLFYVCYTRAGDGATIVERYTMLNPFVADPSSGVVIFGPVAQPQPNHNGGNIRFGLDGKLYIGLGDGGAQDDIGPGHVAGGNAQSGGQLLGKLLRINADGSVPPSNPFLAPGDGFLDQIWDYGLRNPWRWSFDRQTGDLWIGDVGQGLFEELDFHPFATAGGRNFGWHCMEGLYCNGLDGCICNAPSLTLPLHVYGHGNGDCAVIGGYVYRGHAIPDLAGSYFFGDFCTGHVWSLRYNGQTVSNLQDRTAELAPGLGQHIDFITSFGEDSNGELLIVDGQGEIYRIVRDPFTDLGSALPGVSGPPQLRGEGGLLPASQNRLLLSNARPNALALLFVSALEGATAFKGGVLKPFPIQLLVTGATTGAGDLELPFEGPDGLPSGVKIVFQYAIADPAAVQHVALSNALRALAP